MVSFSIHETTGFEIRTTDMHAYPKKGTYNLLLNTLTWKNRVNIFLHDEMIYCAVWVSLVRYRC